MKEKRFEKFILDLGKCNKCTNLNCKEKSLINIYEDYDFSINIPSIWTDWFNRLESKVMIIGQDWGPYSDMKKFNSMLNENKSNWKKIIEQERSNTKRQLERYINISSNGKYTLNDIFVTNAIMCARKGNNYRGNNINLNASTINCSQHLKTQIDIVKPKVILTLGYYPLLSLSKILDFKINKTLKETIEKYPEIIIDDYIIIPLFHPVAQVKKDKQLEQYKRIWKYISN